MADFTPPFSQDGERRLPTTTEQQLGFPCDPQQLRELFNGLFWLHQGQFKSIADEAGVTPDQDGDLTLLKRAVLALIDAATGGNPEGYILMTQARARLPVFPEVPHEDGHLGVLSPSTGVVRVPAGRDFLHRGIFLVTTSQTDFPTDPSKVYHLRWNPTDGFVLRDLASGTYNPSTLAEANPVFDTTFDDMLVARIITNSSNAVTVTNLRNRAVLREQKVTGNFGFPQTGNGASTSVGFPALNWSRVPTAIVTWDTKSFNQNLPGNRDWDESITLTTSRYSVSAAVMLDFGDAANNVLRLTAMG